MKLEKVIDYGESSYIFEVDKYLVAKTYNPSINPQTIYREFDLACLVYSFQIRIPRPISIAEAEILWPEDELFKDYAKNPYPVFLMERIYGINGRVLMNSDLFPKLWERYLKILDEAKNKGFVVSDIKPGNFIYIPENDEIVVIDVERWYKL